MSGGTGDSAHDGRIEWLYRCFFWSIFWNSSAEGTCYVRKSLNCVHFLLENLVFEGKNQKKTLTNYKKIRHILHITEDNTIMHLLIKGWN